MPVVSKHLDLKNPNKLSVRLRNPIFSPTESCEKIGYLTNIVFKTEIARFGEEPYIDYDKADTRIAVASLNITTCCTNSNIADHEKSAF